MVFGEGCGVRLVRFGVTLVESVGVFTFSDYYENNKWFDLRHI